MYYRSTRSSTFRETAVEAIKQGIAGDGGLFVPDIPADIALHQFPGDSTYQETCIKMLQLYLADFTEEELSEIVHAAYNKYRFDHPDIAPLRKLSPELFILELWHGPTCAFKDIALQILPHLMKKSMEKTGDQAEIAILVATSGDTGKAALEGFKDVPGTKIIVFYPEHGVSEIQKLQMITQEGKNVHVVAVKGNFDDAQSSVKEILTDVELNRALAKLGFKFSSANSINWGRLLPQITYYLQAYLKLINGKYIAPGKPVNFVVPTGNFGNILAGYYVKAMGLPINKLICASNNNNILVDFIRTGIYDRQRQFHRTISPSMDILISSNLERLLFEITGGNYAQVLSWMSELKEKGSYSVDQSTAKAIGNIFWADYATDGETRAAIRHIFDEYGYTLDPHTAVGSRVYEKYRAETGDNTTTVVISTASPFKFNVSVSRALLGDEVAQNHTEFALLDLLSDKTGWDIPASLRSLDKRPVRHSGVVEKEKMKDAVKDILFGKGC